MNKLSLVGMQLPKKYKENFNSPYSCMSDYNFTSIELRKELEFDFTSTYRDHSHSCEKETVIRVRTPHYNIY